MYLLNLVSVLEFKSLFRLPAFDAGRLNSELEVTPLPYFSFLIK
jgi:hypothetical protein